MMPFDTWDKTLAARTIGALLLLVVMSLVPTVTGDDITCEMVDSNPCVCKMNNASASYIDLTTASQGEDGPWISALDSTGVRQFTYYYDPCRKFNKHVCKDTLVCQYDMVYDTYYDLGQEKSTKIVYDDSVKGLIMEYTSKDKERKTNVTVICSSSFSFTATEDRLHPRNYIFKLKHPCACVGKCGLYNHPVAGSLPLWGIILASVGGGGLCFSVLIGVGVYNVIKKMKANRYQKMTEPDPHDEPDPHA